MPEKNDLTAGGFEFSDEVVAEKAKKETNAVSYLKNQMSHMNASQILEAYRGLIEQGVFDTAVGYAFLKDVQRFLIADDSIDNSQIPLIEVSSPTRIRQTEAEKQKLKWQRKFHTLLPFTIILLGCVAFMFVLTATSNNMTILNYKDRVESQYAGWEEDLEKRENEVKEREEKLLEEENRADDTNYTDQEETGNGD